MQNKANVKIGKMNIASATIKDYDNEQRTLFKTKPILSAIPLAKADSKRTKIVGQKLNW